MAVRILRWWLPWLLMLAVSSAIAYAADSALQTPAVSAPATAAPRTAGVHWVRIISNSAHGEVVSLLCRVRPNTTDLDTLHMTAAELNTSVPELCEELW